MKIVEACILAVAVLALGACGTSEIASYNKPREPRAERATALHAVRFVPGTTLFETGEEARLRALGEAARQADEPLVVVAAAAGDAQRIARIDGVVQRVGATLRLSPARPAAAPDTVVVQFERYVARNGNCPDWSKSSGYDVNNQAHSNLGCAIAANIQTMVDNPRDLERGRDPGPVNGRIAADAIERLYRDQVKQPAVQATSTIGGTSSGQGQQGAGAGGAGYQQAP